jgi:hypothetical protein
MNKQFWLRILEVSRKGKKASAIAVIIAALSYIGFTLFETKAEIELFRLDNQRLDTPFER